MKRLYIAWIAALITLVGITLTYRGETTSFYGIADTVEVVINSEISVEIMDIPVVQGQLVNKGDTLLKLASQELTLEINEISHELDEYKAQQQVNTKLSRSEILKLQNEQAQKAMEITAEIEQLEAQLAMNKNLTSELKSIKKDPDGAIANDGSNPIKIQIANLRKELEVVLNQSRVNVLQSGLNMPGQPVNFLKQRLELLLEKQKNLLICAQIDGVIGSVDFKEGQKVSPFTPIITLHRKAPSFIKGYIHENALNAISVGQSVRVYSLSGKSSIEGRVVGVGSRIVEYPVRLRKMQSVLMWGREVTVRVPEDNPLLLGEKVRIAY